MCIRDRVKIDAIALGGEINPIEITDALGMDQRGDRSPGNGHGAAFHLRPFGIQPAVANHIRPPLARFESKLARLVLEVERRRIDENLRRGAAIHMPVSYTHLDVYKRQVSRRASPVRSSAPRLPSIRNWCSSITISAARYSNGRPVRVGARKSSTVWPATCVKLSRR